ncbi:hypothetical protein [Tissierella praeacuta]|uniref:hypothetical protein n=1 Tax=Tissierella praeacuta TaxID=43131 RepID=UPI0033415FD9
MEGNSHIISFHAPKEAITLNVNAYRLEGGENLEHYWLRSYFNINAGGRTLYKTDEIILDVETMAYNKDFLQEFHKIEINKEIPVALMVYDSVRSMRNYSLQDYFDSCNSAGSHINLY